MSPQKSHEASRNIREQIQKRSRKSDAVVDWVLKYL